MDNGSRIDLGYIITGIRHYENSIKNERVFLNKDMKCPVWTTSLICANKFKTLQDALGYKNVVPIRKDIKTVQICEVWIELQLVLKNEYLF
mgnify:CR=1 FL=1